MSPEEHSQLTRIENKVDRIQIALDGNGNKGIFQRLEDLEEFKAKSPPPRDRGKILATRAAEVGIAVGVLKGLEILVRWLGIV